MESKGPRQAGSGEKSKEQRHIEKILGSYTYNGFSNLSANVLDRDITTGFAGGDKFVYELLQNADDSSVDGKEVHVQFQVATIANQQYLLFSHNGRHFSRRDVKKITSYADQTDEQDSDDEDQQQSVMEVSKSKDSSKIGYKGVGFKAIFTIADCVVIFSGGYRFRFDSNSREDIKWPKNKPYPWQVMPIWTEENFLPEELRRFMISERVNFLVRIAPNITIADSMKFIRDNTKMLLFLRNVRQVNISNLDTSIGNKKVIQDENIQLIKNQNGKCEIKNSLDALKNSQWLIRSWVVKIDPSVKQELMLMPVQACPDRLKKANDIEITFAAKIVNKKIAQVEHARLFSYLPTQVLSGLPFLINADFLLDPPRAAILDNKWNVFLVGLIARYQFVWLAELAANLQYRLQVLNILGPAELKGVSVACMENYAEEFNSASTSIAFIPGKKIGSILLPSNALTDTTRFYDDFPELAPDFEGKELIESKLECKDKLQIFRMNQIDFRILLSLVRQHCRTSHSADLHFKIISFIFNHKKEFDQSQLRRAEFLYTHNNRVASPENTYFKREEGCDQYPGIGELYFIHPELLARLPQSMVAWLSSLDVQEATAIKLFKKHVIKMIDKNQLTVENIATFTRFIFDLYCQNLLSPGDFEKLKKLKVLTKQNKLVEAWRCYLPNCFSPTLSLDDLILDTNLFISETYYIAENNNVLDKNKLERWGKFFSKIGVNGDIFFVAEDVKVTEVGGRIWKFKEYLQYLQRHGQASTQVYPNHTIENLVYSPMMSLVENPSVLPLILGRAKQHWPLLNNGRSMSYQMSKTFHEISMAYITFIFSTHRCLTGIDSKPYKSSELFSKEFKNLTDYNKSIITVSNDMNLDDDLLRYCGIVYELSFDQCFSILDGLDKQTEIEIEISCYRIVWGQLLKLEQKLNTFQKSRLQSLKKYPTQTNELKSKNVVKLFAVEDRCAPYSPCWLKHFPEFTLDEMHSIAVLFGVTIYSEKKHKPDFGKNPPQLEQETLNVFLGSIPNSQWTIMGVLVFLEARHRGEKKYDILWNALSEALMRLKFFRAESIVCKYGDNREAQESVQVYLEDNCLYYKRNWQNQKRINEFLKAIARYLRISDQSIQKLHHLILGKRDKILKNLPKMMIPSSPPFEQKLLSTKEGSIHSAKGDILDKHPNETDGSNRHLEDNIAQSDDEGSNDEFLPGGATPPEPYELNTPPDTISPKETPPGTPFLSQHQSKDRPRLEDKPTLKLVNPAGFDFSRLRKIPDAQYTVKKKAATPHKVSLSLLKEEHIHDSGQHSNNDSGASAPKIESGPSREAGVSESAPRPTKQELSVQDKNRIGRCGEELIYLHLRDKYLSKYGDNIIDGKNGFEITTMRGGEAVKITVIWHNKDEKRDEDRDITIIKPPNKHDINNTEQAVYRFLEVKATTTSKQTFNWTAREVALARTEGYRYKLIHIKNIDTDDPSVVKIRNPIQKLDKELVVEGYKIGF